LPIPLGGQFPSAPNISEPKGREPWRAEGV